MNYTTMNNFELTKVDSSQPLPLILDNDSNFILQPIIEDIQGQKFIVILRLYYKDRMPENIIFKKGEPLETYCSDSTIMTLYLKAQQPVVIGSIKRMSCKILAIFNVSKQQNILLKTHPVDSIKIRNYVTDDEYVFAINDRIYFSHSVFKHTR
jgi:hypothetical protein